MPSSAATVFVSPEELEAGHVFVTIAGKPITPLAYGSTGSVHLSIKVYLAHTLWCCCYDWRL